MNRLGILAAAAPRVIGGVAALAAIAFSPLAHADGGDQSDAEQAVTAIYNQVQRRCTPSMPPHLQSITWTSFTPASYGEGTIHDANSALGGSFTVSYFNPRVGPAQDGPAGRAYGQWGVNLEFC
jgi:hypothetical protein